MKKIIAAVFAVICVLLFSACGGRQTVESDNYFGFFPVPFQTLNYLVYGDDAVKMAAAISVEAAARADRFGMIEPALATRFRELQNGTVWEVTLRRGAGWYTHNGERFADVTAHDFAAGINFILEPSNNSAHHAFVSEYVYGVHARNNTTIVYTLTRPVPYFPSLLTKLPFLPVNQQFLDGAGENFGTCPETLLFSGSHLLQSWNDDGLVFVKNENYHLSNRIHVNTITFMNPDDDADVIAMFAEGRLSNAVVPPELLLQTRENPELSPFLFQTEPHGASTFFVVNMSSSDANVAAAFQNANFRRALFYAVNRLALMGTVMPENHERYFINTVNTPQTAFSGRNRDYLRFGCLPALAERQTNNPAEAARLLRLAKAELGDTVNWPVVLFLPRRATEEGVIQSRLFSQMIEAAFDGDVTVDFRVYSDEWEHAFYLERGEFDIGISTAAPMFADPSSALSAFLPGAAWNYYFNVSSLEETQTFAEMFAEAAAETNIDRRFTLFSYAETFLLDSAIILPFHREGGEFALSRETRPFRRMTAHYGLSRFLFLDRTFGPPLTAAERTALFYEYQRDLVFAGR